MSDLRAAIDDLVERTPGLEADLETLLEIDEAGPWEFDDIPLDSGVFGELVSIGAAEKIDGAYRLTDRQAVKAALGNEPIQETTDTSRDIEFSLPQLDRSALAPLAVGLAIIFIARIYMYPQVFRPEAITLLGNDPYFYRYWILELAQADAGLFAVPDGFHIGEPLLVATIWTLTVLVGGTAETGFTILAWYPVGSALLSGALLYWLALLLTNDRRVGLATLIIIAVTPVLGFRTALGFADHHAFDFIWLALTMAAIGYLATRTERSVIGTILGIVGVALGVSGEVLAWNAGALLLVPIGMYGVVHAYSAVRDRRSAIRELGPATIGIGLGALVAGTIHLQWGWQTQNMVLPPALLAGGLVGIILVAETGRILDLSAPIVGGGVLGIGLLSIVATTVFFPEFTAEAVNELAELGGAGDIAENTSIFSTDLGLFAGPFFFFGLSLFFALPYIVWGMWAGIRRGAPVWLLASSYGVVFFVLGIIRARFAGQLALVAAVFSGIAFVHIYAIVTDDDRPAVLEGTAAVAVRDISWQRPDRSTVFAVVGVFLLIGGLGAVMTPLRVDILTYSENEYDAAIYMNDYAIDHDLEYPASYVFSAWGENRMYNALVSGESSSYSFARANYNDFIVSTNGSQWYNRVHDRGFIVTTEYRHSPKLGQDSLYTQLHEESGFDTAHYRLLYAPADGSVAVFQPVQGATITGTTDSNRTVSVTGEMDVDPTPKPIERTIQTNETGAYRFSIPTPGTYQIGSQTVTINESAVQRGETIAVE